MEYFATVGRILLGAFFLMGGLGKFADPNFALLQLEQTGVMYADKVVWLIAAIEVAGGAALLVGFGTRLAALLLAASAIFLSVMLTPFWTEAQTYASPMFLTFVKSLMPVAGLLLVLGFGPGPLSVDANE